MEKLSGSEEEVMQAIWQQKEGFIRDFIDRIPGSPPYTTVASIVKNLERKQYIKAKKVANSYWYTPLIDVAVYNRNHLSALVKDYFSNSYKEIVSFFAKEQKISPDELKEIIKMIEKK